MYKAVREYVQGYEGITYVYGNFRNWIQPWISTTFDAQPIMDVDESVDGRIVIGDLASSCNREALKNQGITHVVNAILGGSERFPDFEYKNFPLRDIPEEQIHEFFTESNTYFDQVLNESPDNKIFIHCICGVSRSSTLLAAYLMYKLQLSAEDAVTSIQKCRPVVQPNEGFMEQLENYQKTLELLKTVPKL